MKTRWIIGIDEVGRGALAGPVTVGVVAIRANATRISASAKLPLRDSKKLSPTQREAWVKHMRVWKRERGDIYFATKSMSHKVVDKINVAQAANRAATRALQALLIDSAINPKYAKVFLDGGLYVNGKHSVKFPKTETIIRGDEKVSVIALASIMAKVTRDRKLTRLDAEYPVYKFAMHKGYGTKVHIKAIKKHGISDIHRLTFTSKWANI
ncbi:MAG: ribonuclease HII [Patescibacteria group bacterium]